MADVEVDMNNHVDENKRRNEVLGGKKMPKNILRIFPLLSDTFDGNRKEAIVDLVTQLLEKHRCQDKEATSDISNCLDRLIRGLASSRKASRLGYYVTLVELLRALPTVVEAKDVIELISKHLENAEGRQENCYRIGTVLAYGAVIRSGRISKDPVSVTHVCEKLMVTHTQVEFLQEICTNFLVELFTQVDGSMFRQHVWPIMESHFACDLSVWTPNVLYMILKICDAQKELTETGKGRKGNLFPKFWNDILNEKNFKVIAEILTKTTSGHPRIHPVCTYVLTLMGERKGFCDFWKVLTEAAFEKQQKEKLYLLFELLKECFRKNLIAGTSVKKILLPPIVQVLITNLAHKEMLLHGAAAELSKVLTQCIKNCEDGRLQFEFIECLMEKPGSVMYDALTRQNTILSILPHLKPEATTKLISYLKNIFATVPTREECRLTENYETNRQAALQKLTQVVGLAMNGNQNIEILKDNLKFFSFHAFFDQMKRSKYIPECSNECVEVTEDLHKVSRECFFRLISVQNPKRLTKSTLRHHCIILNDVLLYIRQLLQNPDTAKPIMNFDNKCRKMLDKVLDFVENANLQMDKDENCESKCHAFQVLFLNFGLQLFVDAKSTMDILQEVFICYEKSMAEQSGEVDTEAGERQPEWIEVVVDILLGVLSQKSHVLRLIATNVFLLLVPSFTTRALQQILNVIDPSSAEEEPMLEGTDDEAEDSEVEESGSSEGEDSDEKSNESTDVLRRSVKNALGEAAANSDEDEDEVYLDDDAMERVDESLSEVFRTSLRKKESLSKESEVLLHFRNRCIQLLPMIVASKPSVQFILHTILPVISAIEFGQREKGQESLAACATNCLRKIICPKKLLLFHSEHAEKVDPELIFNDVLRGLINKFQTVSDHNLSNLLVDCCTHLIKCALYCDQTNSVKDEDSIIKDCISIYKDSLIDYFKKNDYRIPDRLFVCLIDKYLVYGWSLVDVLIEYAFKEKIRLFKRSRAVAMLAQLCSHFNTLKTFVSRKCWHDFANTCITNISESLNTILSSEMKPNYVGQLLQLLSKVLHADQQMGLKVTNFPENLVTQLFSLGEKRLSKPSKILIPKIIPMLQKDYIHHKEQSVKGTKRKVLEIKSEKTKRHRHRTHKHKPKPVLG